jgi:hypothetical protein
VNIGAPWPDLDEAERRVLAMQTKLHRWAASDPGRRFDDLYNLVYDAEAGRQINPRLGVRRGCERRGNRRDRDQRSEPEGVSAAQDSHRYAAIGFDSRTTATPSATSPSTLPARASPVINRIPPQIRPSTEKAPPTGTV